MDKLDQKIVGILRHDSRIPVSALAEKLGITRNTVKARIDRLLKSGEIVGFSITLRSDVETSAVRGIVLVTIGRKPLEPIIAELNSFPEIQAIHTTSGQWDLALEVGTDSINALDKVLNRLREVDGLLESETTLFLSTKRSVGRQREVRSQ